MSKFSFMKSLFVSLILIQSGSALAQSHAMIDQSRSSLAKNVFIYQAVDGEYGRFEKTSKDGTKMDQSWKGYGIRNGFGVEVFKFIEFSLAHTLLNTRSNESSLESMQGSRLSGEIAFQFSAPITNIQFGLGMTASQMAYQDFDKTSTFMGVGRYYMMGLNYFLTPSVSLQAQGRRIDNIQKAAGGSSLVTRIESQTDNLSLGFGIWL